MNEEAQDGHEVSPATRRKISKAMQGASNFDGHTHTNATKSKLRRARGDDDRVNGRRWRTDKKTGEESRVYSKGDGKRYRWGRSIGEAINWNDLEQLRDLYDNSPVDLVSALNISTHPLPSAWGEVDGDSISTQQLDQLRGRLSAIGVELETYTYEQVFEGGVLPSDVIVPDLDTIFIMTKGDNTYLAVRPLDSKTITNLARVE